jgi:F-type H+-transporting ATPase subunit b
MQKKPNAAALFSMALAATLCALATPPVLAAEGGGGNPFSGDIGNALWTLVIFVGVLWVLGKFAWGPLLQGLQKREEFIRGALEDARRQRDESEARLKEYERKIAEARNEATEIVDEGRRDAEVVKQRIQEEARKEADQIIERARREIAIAAETAVKDIYDRAAALATDAASRIIRKELKPEDQERLIAEAIDSLDQLQAN